MDTELRLFMIGYVDFRPATDLGGWKIFMVILQCVDISVPVGNFANHEAKVDYFLIN